MPLVRSEVVSDIHFTGRWQYHWFMEEGLSRRAEFRMTPGFFENRSHGARPRRTRFQREKDAPHIR
jgi:hypothetical protein